jgi:hypothetical protein
LQTLEDLSNGSGQWYIPLEPSHSTTPVHASDASGPLLSLESGFQLHSPATFIGTTAATTFLPLNGNFRRPIAHRNEI